MLLKGKKIVLGVTGGIAVYKAVDLVSRLRKQGAEVRVVMTEHARQFVTPLTFKEISGNAVATSMWNSNQEFNVEQYRFWQNWADVFVVARLLPISLRKWRTVLPTICFLQLYWPLRHRSSSVRR